MIAVIGSFDGFHTGHRKLFSVAGEVSGKTGDSWSVVTFFPHPQTIIGKSPFSPLFTEPEKDILGRCLNIPEIIRIPFNEDLACMGPEAFIDVLESRLFLRCLVVGEDFRFGRKRTGDPSLLKELGEQRGWETVVVPSLSVSGRKIGSSLIREFVLKGKVQEAASDLGYPFMITGMVKKGDGRGRTIGFPTVNLSLPANKITPSRGVYAGSAVWDGKCYPAAVNIGLNPTFPGKRDLRCEAHIPGFRGELYGQWISLFFLQKLRPEIAFESPAHLVDKMKEDVVLTMKEWELLPKETLQFMSCCSAEAS